MMLKGSCQRDLMVVLLISREITSSILLLELEGECLGMLFGLASVIFPLALLVYHFNWELPNQMKPTDLDMTEDFGLTVGRKNDMCLIPTIYDA
jgi:hypothetical protein